MEGKKAKILAGAAGVVLVALELTLFLCFRLSRPFYLSTAVILSAVLAGTVTVLLCHALSPHGRAERMVRRPVLDGGEEVSAVRVEYSYFRKVAGLPSRFSLEALSAATDGFQYVVGRGSSGTVFKGILDDGTSVAVKRINGSAHVDKEFRSEVSAIGSVQHVSLVRLLGFCLVRNGPRFLVYEYMENGSLDRWIFPQHDAGGEAGGRCLTWVQRYQVAVDVAKALAYLHHDCRAKVVHLDVKPENILLDDRLRGMLSDFGLSTLMGKEQSRVVTTVRGTTGYLAPEWLLGAGVTEKSDVYSYGMVLMEILGGRRNLQAEPGPSGGSRRWSYFPKLVADRAQEGRVVELLDRRLVSSTVDEASVRRLAHVALWCAQEKPGARPHHGARRGDARGQGRRRERGAAAAAVGHGPGGPARARSRADDRTVRAPRAATGTRLGGDGRVVGDEHGRFVRALLPVRPVAHDAQWLCRARQFRSDRSAIEDSTPRGCCHWTTQERCGDWCVVSDFSLTNCTTTECNH